MLKKQKTIFKDRNKLDQLINLRIIGFSTETLACLFNVERTDLTYHFKKYKIEQPEVVYNIQRIVKEIIPKEENKWRIENGKRINLGKSYDDYLKDYSHRKEKEKAYN
jgi:hypothetical protein